MSTVLKFGDLYTMLTTQDIAVILFCIPIYQLVFYTVQLMTFKQNSVPTRWNLGLLLLSLSVFLIISTLFYLDYQQGLAWSFYFFTPVFLLLTPLYYKYLINITGHEQSGFWNNNIVLFLPSVLLLILNILTYGKLDYIEKLLFLYSGFSLPESTAAPHFLSEIVFLFGFVFLAIIQAAFYSIQVVKILNAYKSGEETNASHHPFVETRWLSYIYLGLISFILINIVFHMFSNGIKLSVLLIYNILMVITGALIGYLGMKQESLYEYIDKLSLSDSETYMHYATIKKERTVTITDEEKKEVLEDLKKLMTEKKLYLNSRLSIDGLAKRLNVNKRVISIVVNDEMATNIYGFINDYRIQESKRIISDPDMHYLSIEGIAEKVGFKSKSCFYASFKKVTGQTPSQFKYEDQR